ncbi:H(+)/Cl(-) exchange transporter ClcA [Methylovulum psychrotolerans]|uniref:H(+)/Cl(-) exchange transporter ClcA n=1 Tax=Methylovulum psychrotolerans TaxID=1704499 RepID=A0A2S5CJI7_9GAMM|nr:H(+)/Cl(-) exchange transporter ClcA [Methylovulum psychrotolerans]
MQEQLPRRSKRKYLAFGCENPIKNTSRSDSLFVFLNAKKSIPKANYPNALP